MRCRSFSNMLLVSMLLSACATPYQKASLFHLAGGGFGEQKISDTEYWVYFNGNGLAAKDHVLNMWVYRCAELTVEKGFPYMLIHPGEKPPVQKSGSDDQWMPTPASPEHASSMPQAMPAVLHADMDAHAMPVKGGGYRYYYTPGTTITTWNAAGTANLYRAPLPDDVVWAMDARRVMQLLQAYKDSNGEQAAPSSSDLVWGSFVAHEQISFPVAPFPAFPNVAHMHPQPTTTAPLPAWDAADILAGIRNQALIKLHAMFRARRDIVHLSNGGTILLSFTVDQFGWITDCEVVSTSFTDPGFVAAVQQVFGQVKVDTNGNFADTYVPKFLLTFTPDQGR